MRNRWSMYETWTKWVDYVLKMDCEFKENEWMENGVEHMEPGCDLNQGHMQGVVGGECRKSRVASHRLCRVSV